MRSIKTFVIQSVMQSIYDSRILTGSSYDVPTTDLMRQLKWQTLED